MRSLTVLLVLAALAPVAAAAKQPNPGVVCTTVARRQTFPDAPGLTFRVVKLAVMKPGATHMHRHKSSELIYLLSGSGTNTMNGKAKALTADKAILIPAGTDHVVTPSTAAGVSVLAVQFSDHKSPAWTPKSFKGPNSCND